MLTNPSPTMPDNTDFRGRRRPDYEVEELEERKNALRQSQLATVVTANTSRCHCFCEGSSVSIVMRNTIARLSKPNSAAEEMRPPTLQHSFPKIICRFAARISHCLWVGR